MYIIGSMAFAAAAVGRSHLCKRAPMTLIAGNFDVRAGQRKIGLQVVVKYPLVPRNRVVAGAALVLEIAVVRIVFLVTRNAGGLDPAVFLCLVAVSTFRFVVRAEQRE
jgi:hypothetical protein